MIKEKAALEASTTNELLLAALSQGGGEIYADLSTAEWEELIHLAARFGVTPLLYQHLRHINIPQEIAERLQQAYRHNALDNMRLYGELRKVFEAFKAAEIPVMVLKGVFLAQAIYPNIALRTMSDADLLVRKEDLARAKEEMLALGYLPSAEGATSHQHLPPFYRQAFPEDKIRSKRIEIHWTILADNSPFEIDVEELWERAQPIKIANVEVLSLSPEDLLLHLVLHASYQHRFAFGVRPFCDISLTIQHYQEQIDWQTLLERAYLWRASKVLYLTLLLTQELLNTPIPPHALSALKPAKLPDKLVVQAKEQLFADRSQHPPVERQTARIWGAEGVLDKVRLAHESLFLPKEVIARLYSVPIGSPRLYLYYLVRLKYLLGQHGSQVWELLVRREEKIVNATQREYALLSWLSSP